MCGFSKDGAKFLSKPISNLFNISITSENLPDSCKVVKLKPLYKERFLTQPYNYRPTSLLPLISKVIDRIMNIDSRSNKYFSEFEELIIHLSIWFWRKAFYVFLTFLFKFPIF